MGYRSDIAIAIHKDLQGDFLTFLNTEELMAEIFGDSSDFELDKDYQGEGHWLFTAEDIKWYTNWDDFADVQMFQKFMDEMDKGDQNKWGKYRFIRLGEEIDDIEYRGEWWEGRLGVSRRITAGGL
jgi:hypothetical protein